MVGAGPAKRAAADDGGAAPSGLTMQDGPRSKAPRLSENRVAALPVGSNLVECNGKSCTHEVAWPPGQEGPLTPPPAHQGPPARTYPFTIDPFQQTAVNALEAGHSVLVAAHTSAGKTVVAEYAFAMALRDKTRVIYTSPLKALSNQKYRELREEFGDVGLMTGDVTINEGASCLVMTTEILRSMLYRGSEVVREVQLLVYDEIHYLRDKERGVVWEESIILAPKACRFAFLSATIPNAMEFAMWIAKTHGSPCHVVYTDYRPTPLQHYIFPTGGDSLYMVVDERGVFRDDNFQKAVAVVHDAGPTGASTLGVKGKEKKSTGTGEESDVFKLVKMIMERNYDPVIVFSFSKRECDKLAGNMMSLDLTDDTEKALIKKIFESAIACLNADDQKLPQIAKVFPMLQQGIGIHHSGYLPIIKEAIEILFQEGLLKVLFATETFSTGLNMPAKTVVFTNVRKFDGADFRWITSGEYIQMSGRAGRRGLDDRGIVMLMLDAKMEASVAKNMIKGAPDVMYSEFHLGYNMLLNIIRLEGNEPEQLMQASFRQFQLERSLPRLEAKLKLLEEQYEAASVPDEDKVKEYLELLERLALLQSDLRSVLAAPKHSLPFLQPGRLVRVLPSSRGPGQPLIPPFDQVTDEQVAAAATVYGDKSVGGVPAIVNGGVWGVVVGVERQGKKDTSILEDSKDKDKDKEKDSDGPSSSSAKAGASSSSSTRYLVDVLVNSDAPASQAAAAAAAAAGGQQAANAASTSESSALARLLPPQAKRGTPQVVTVALSQVDCMSTVRVLVAKDLRSVDARKDVIKRVGEVVVRLMDKSGCVPALDPTQDMKVKDKTAAKLVGRLATVQGMLKEHRLASDPHLRQSLAMLQQKETLSEQIKVAKRELKAAQQLVLQDDLKHMQRVLRRLGYVDSQGVITVKGKVAAYIQSGDELVLTEMVFDNAFKSLNTEQLLAACCCFVCQEKPPPGFKLSEPMRPVYQSVQENARRVAKLSNECKVEVDEDEFVDSFRPSMMDSVAAWSRGIRFADLHKMTKIHEGVIVRTIRRLDELLRQLEDAMKSIGEVELAEKFEAAAQRIKRDVVFAASLYL